jgi:hypothetical protein
LYFVRVFNRTFAQPTVTESCRSFVRFRAPLQRYGRAAVRHPATGVCSHLEASSAPSNTVIGELRPRAAPCIELSIPQLFNWMTFCAPRISIPLDLPHRIHAVSILGNIAHVTTLSHVTLTPPVPRTAQRALVQPRPGNAPPDAHSAWLVMA